MVLQDEDVDGDDDDEFDDDDELGGVARAAVVLGPEVCRSGGLRRKGEEEEQVREMAAADGGKRCFEKASFFSRVTRGLISAQIDSILISVLPLLCLISATGRRHPGTGCKGAGGRHGDDENDINDECSGGDDSAIDRDRRDLGGGSRAAAPGSRRLPLAIAQSRGLGCVVALSPAEF